MATFVLIHGAWHGAWCWDRLRPELERGGHGTVAVDLPADDPGAGAGSYVDAVLEAIADEPRPVLVAHSMGGLTAARVAALRPVLHVVYLSALVPRPGMSWLDQKEAWAAPHFPAGAQLDSDRCHRWRWEAATRAALHPDCDSQTAHWAWGRLRRQCYGMLRDPFTGSLREAPATYLLARDDRAVSPDYSRRAAAELLEQAPIELEGGHWLLMTDPARLAAVLSSLKAS